jgi:hypothetical protein
MRSHVPPFLWIETFGVPHGSPEIEINATREGSRRTTTCEGPEEVPDGGASDNQRRKLEAVAQGSGWKVVKIYEDAGISGANGRDRRQGLMP